MPIEVLGTGKAAAKAANEATVAPSSDEGEVTASVEVEVLGTFCRLESGTWWGPGGCFGVGTPIAKHCEEVLQEYLKDRSG